MMLLTNSTSFACGMPLVQQKGSWLLNSHELMSSWKPYRKSVKLYMKQPRRQSMSVRLHVKTLTHSKSSA